MRQQMTRRGASDGLRIAEGIELTWPGKHDTSAATEVPDLVCRELIEPGRLEVTQSELFAKPTSSPHDPAWRNLLVQGDNLTAMRALQRRVAGQVDLIYIDPPYATGVSYYSQTDVGREKSTRRAYRDRREGMTDYLESMYRRFQAMHALLSDDGKLFVHCDWRANAMIRLLLDEVFGPGCFRNEIVWRRAPNLGRQAASRQLGRVIDTIYVYSKTAGSPFAGEVPRRTAAVPLDRKGKPKGARWDDEREAYFTTAPRGDYTDDSIAKLRKLGRVFESSTGTIYVKYFLRLGDDGRWYKDQPADALWDDFDVRPLRHRPKAEDMGYDTQKPEGLLERIISWSTKPGDLVADFFCGSGTTPAVAERLGRRWIACDRGSTAIHVTKRRLLDGQPSCAPFSLMSWDGEGHDAAQVARLYGAEPHGEYARKEDALVVVTPELPTALQIAQWGERARDDELVRLDVLAANWNGADFAALRAAAPMDVAFRAIPADAKHAKGRRKGVRFAAATEVELELLRTDAGIGIRIAELNCDQPHDVEWPELVDAWMIDWTWNGHTFTPQWRTSRQRGELQFESPCRQVPDGGMLAIKVTTIFGEDVLMTMAC